MNILVRNVPKLLTEEKLMACFRPFGVVTAVSIIVDQTTGQSRGFGFVSMPQQAEGEAAIKGLHHTVILDEKIRVKEANPKYGPSYYAVNKQLPRVPEQSAPPRPAYPAPVRRERPPVKAGAREHRVPDERGHASTRAGGKPAYKPHSAGERSSHPYARFLKRDVTRPASAPRGERSSGYQGSSERSDRPKSQFPPRDGIKSAYQPRGERPFRPQAPTNSSARSSRPPTRFPGGDAERPRSPFRGERSAGYQGSPERSAQSGSRFPSRDAGRPEYKPRGSGERSSHPPARFPKRAGGRFNAPSRDRTRAR